MFSSFHCATNTGPIVDAAGVARKLPPLHVNVLKENEPAEPAEGEEAPAPTAVHWKNTQLAFIDLSNNKVKSVEAVSALQPFGIKGHVIVLAGNPITSEEEWKDLWAEPDDGWTIKV